MSKRIGKISFPKQKLFLEYLIIQKENGEYGVAIAQSGAEYDYAEKVNISHDIAVAEKLAYSFAKGMVFPRHLPNILEDMGL